MPFQPRTDYGRLFEPAGHAILHGAGQDDNAFRLYTEAVAPYTPCIYMAYCGLQGKKIQLYGSRLRELLAAYDCGANIMLQIGVGMTYDGSPENHYEQDVASGIHDDSIKGLCEMMRIMDRPVFLRIGYEFNGEWNGYVPETYIAAWRRISDALDAAGCDNVAKVWCYEPGAEDTDYMKWYPGDAYVDWWALDCFSVEDFQSDVASRFCQDAATRRFPVMIGESTARYVGVGKGEASWAGWYAPYFDFIDTHTNIKALCYIDWNWVDYRPMWFDWGDCRIEQDEIVLARWREIISDPVFVHA